MKIEDLQRKMVAVLGFGMEGRATTSYLIKNGVRPVLFDKKPWDEWQKSDKEYIESLQLHFIFGPDCFKELSAFDIAFRSPGIPLTHPDIQVWSSQVGHSLTSQTKWFFDYCPAMIIGVTGTSGKGTTSTLIYNILEANPQKKASVYLTGNIGKVQPFDFLDAVKKNDQVVYELSSFQLQDLTKSPHIGVVLMTTVEHLDHHADVQEYHAAKGPIVSFQSKDDFAIYNTDYKGSVTIAKKGDGEKITVSRFKTLDRGCFIEDNQLIVKEVTGRNFQFPISNFQLRGQHNMENFCAAVAVASILGIDPKIIQMECEKFKGLEHRLEYVGEKKGVVFYNDSISTRPEAAIAALHAFTEPLILILGGSSKQSDFTSLGLVIAQKINIKGILLIGQESDRLKEVIINNNFAGKIVEGVQSMDAVFEHIHSLAKTGDIVLLSPACASFGMFENYRDRGEQFKACVDRFKI